ncbi:DUF1989 domain-containing protein [Vibrio barjaei]|uniref:DUF1989 domain-containing protein n=1 Tax=Vibrio barjaei TaxID=1676683 RepID=UPI0007BB300F|nr:DUF1989 domain-containing protein [Vibrio barjaei]OIN24661.1 hypothetical protein AWH66_2019710 [Vibrio barjaei]
MNKSTNATNQAAMEEQDLIKMAKAKVNAPFDTAGIKAKQASIDGKLELVNEFEMQPYHGSSFEVKKGQVLRYEVMQDSQIIDCFYMVKERPMEEYADSFNTACFGPHVQVEGSHYYSNTPFGRPLLTLTRDTVNNKLLKEKYGPLAAHSYVLHNGACNASTWEHTYGTVNANNCHVNFAEAFLKLGGEKLARRYIQPAAFMHFQPIAFDKLPDTALTYFPSDGVIKTGDFVELLVHEDLLVAVSLCPMGNQNELGGMEDMVCSPVKVKIFEGKDCPLETAPNPNLKSANAVDFVLSGRPGMITGKIAPSKL